MPALLRCCAGNLNGLILLACLVPLGLAVTQYKLSFDHDYRGLGFPDSGAYYLQAHRLFTGRGLTVNYMPHHFDPGPPDIIRHEDHWPPMLSLLMIPFFWIFGDSFHSARITCIVIGSIFLPLAAAWLGCAFTRRSWVGLLAGAAMLTNLPLFTGSMYVLADVLLAALLAAFVASLLDARRHRWMHLPAGIFLAGCYYAKGSQLVLLGLYPLLVLMIEGLRAQGGVHTRWPWLGMATAMALMLPWWVVNVREHHNPFYSSQNYVSSYYGLVPGTGLWNGAFWGQDKPKTTDRWTKYKNVYWERTRLNMEDFTRHALLGAESQMPAWDDFGRLGAAVKHGLDPRTRIPPPVKPGAKPAKPPEKWLDPQSEITGAGATLFVAGMMLLGIPLAVVRQIRKRSRAGVDEVAPPPEADDDAPLLGPTAAILLLLFVQWAFIVFLWGSDMARFTFLFCPFFAVFVFAMISNIIEAPVKAIEWLIRRPPGPIILRQFQRYQWGLTAALGITLMFLAHRYATPMKAAHARYVQHRNYYPYRDDPAYAGVGALIKSKLPDAILMCTSPEYVLAFCGDYNKGIVTPYAPAGRIFAIARYYRVTHFYANNVPPMLEPYVKGALRGFKPVSGIDHLFELDYSLLPDEPLPR
ncbi:MAG TPA: hypothetical protein VIL86_06475 [Tepidisphaeraceae bacterium]